MNTNRSRITQLNRKHRSAAALLVLLTMLLSTAMVLSSCGVIHQVFSKKVEITFDAAGGVITGDDVKEGKSDSCNKQSGKEKIRAWNLYKIHNQIGCCRKVSTECTKLLLTKL